LYRQKTNDIKKNRLFFIDNLRILLSALVVIVHVACTYGGPGGWAYTEKGADLFTIFPLTVLNATSQSFFMGMFFFISAYFTHKSFQRKGFVRFLKDRVMRLGIPLVLTYYLISPVTNYLAWPVKYQKYADATFAEIWNSGNSFGPGVMWFVEALIYFTILYLLAYLVFPWLRKTETKPLPKITSKHIFLFSIILGVITFLVRIQYPLFKNHYGLHFDLGHFPQYIFLFGLGIIAARYKPTDIFQLKQAKKWIWFLAVMIVFVFPLLFILGNAYEGGLKPFAGRGTWHSFAYAIWEQLVGISIIVVLLGISKTRWNTQSRFTSKLSASAYAVYVLHPPVLVGISILFINWKTMLLFKFLALTPLALVASFAVAIIIKRIPGLQRIF
jgi:peptidoglycan/LPS O-acetylase OafA/YrhL